jgi:hypothetical protein
VFDECVTPDHILILIEVSVKELAYFVAIAVIVVNKLDKRAGFVQGHMRNISLRLATTVPIKRDSHQVHMPSRIYIEIGKDAAVLETQGKAARPGWYCPDVFRNLHGYPN